MNDEVDLTREAVRLYRRYAVELVERFNLCPWAERARLTGKTQERVFPQKNSENLAPSLTVLRELEALPHIDIGLLIYPLLDVDLARFEVFARRLGRAYTEQHAPASPPFVMATFHPSLPPHTPTTPGVKDNPEVLVPYVRRTPDPTLQIVRYSVLEQARSGQPNEGTEFFDLNRLGLPTTGQKCPVPPPSLRTKIAQRNVETLLGSDAGAFEAALADILRDRNETYSRWR